MAKLNFAIQTTQTASASSDKWRRTRGDNQENVAGSILASDFTALIDDNGVIPSGVALAEKTGAAGYYVPLAIAANIADQVSLAGFISDQTGVDVDGVDESGVTVAIRETIVPKYLPVAAQRVIDSTFPTSGVFVFIKE